jgi:hypothetical protein
VSAELSIAVEIPVRHPAGDLLSCKSAFLPICHMLVLDSVYTTTPWGKSRFHRTNASDRQELRELVHTISHRVAGFLEREGIAGTR